MRRLGEQRPTFEVVGEYHSSLADAVIEMFESYGRKYYDSQKYEMRLFYARNEDGDYACHAIYITKPRQNGKSFAARDYAIDQAAVAGKKVLYSAHNTKTVSDMFSEIKTFVESHEDFASSIVRKSESMGFWSLEFDNGGLINFSTRTNSGGRGGTYEVIILDEAQEITEAHLNAIVPSASASGELDDGNSGPQLIYIGTVPDETCNGTMFRRMHDKAHGGGRLTFWWLEWGVQAENLDDIDIYDPELWYMTNPAMGRRISEETVRNEADQMDRAGFARERLGWWPPQVANAIIDYAKWRHCLTEEPPDTEPTFAIKFGVDGTTASIVAAMLYEDGKPYVEFVKSYDMHEGLTQVRQDAMTLHDGKYRVFIDGKSNAEPLQKQMVAAGANKKLVVIPRPDDVAVSCSEFLNAVSEENIAHIDQHTMDEAVKTSTRRPIGNRGGWGFRGAYETVMEAAAIAVWGSGKTLKPKRKARFNV